MPKISKAEYEVLKGLDDKWKWIARDKDGVLGVYDAKVVKTKFHNFWIMAIKKKIDLTLFSFIQWEDEEPHNIAELIEEYEINRVDEMLEKMNIPTSVIEDVSKSEETEVKDLKWLNNEVEKRIKKIKTDEVSFAGSDYFDEGYIHGMRDVQSIANQLDEPEVLSQELPVIPKFVADWIEKAKRYHSISWLLNYENIKGWSHELTLWCFESGNDDNLHKLARAWLDGYEIEQEPKYYAKVKGWGANGNDGHAYYSGKFPLSLTMSTESVAHTKDEWKNYGVYEDNADFVKVEELEE